MNDGLPLADAFAQAVGHQQAGRLADAEQMLHLILAAAPAHPETLYFLGLVESEQNRFADAAVHIEAAIAAAPANPLFTHHVYEIYRRLGRTQEALAAVRRAIAAHPGDAMMQANLAAIHHDRCELDRAIAAARAAIALQPDLPEAHFALAESLLLTGDLQAGFREYEWRWRIAKAGRLMTPEGLPEWDGRPTRRRLLLVADQGFGDIIMFARYLERLRARCPDIVMACPQELHGLMAQLAPGIALCGRWDAPAAEIFCPLSGLPHRFRTRLTTIPQSVPYLTATQARLPVPTGQRAIGLVWAGAPEHHNDRNRSFPFAALAPLLACDGVTFVSLQKGAARAELSRDTRRAKVIDAGRRLRNFADTAAIVAALDLIITADTSVAHLAGAMGKPVWILLPHVPDWRWLLARTDSPWYPTARLFRQATPGDWAGVMAAVAAALADEA